MCKETVEVHKHSSFPPHKNIYYGRKVINYYYWTHHHHQPRQHQTNKQTTTDVYVTAVWRAHSNFTSLIIHPQSKFRRPDFRWRGKRTANFHQTHSMSWKIHSRCAGKQISIFRGFSSLCVSICRFVHIENVSFCIFKQFCLLLPRLSRFLATIKFIHGFIVSPYCSAFRNAFFMNEKLENWQFPALLSPGEVFERGRNFYVCFREFFLFSI